MIGGANFCRPVVGLEQSAAVTVVDVEKPCVTVRRKGRPGEIDGGVEQVDFVHLRHPVESKPTLRGMGGHEREVEWPAGQAGRHTIERAANVRKVKGTNEPLRYPRILQPIQGWLLGQDLETFGELEPSTFEGESLNAQALERKKSLFE